jgi:hypothetical protein
MPLEKLDSLMHVQTPIKDLQSSFLSRLAAASRRRTVAVSVRTRFLRCCTFHFPVS